mmetsp:Transcript_56180/g.180323  ORF Transcript_56180/g.180323 Transcript_56180/m.180323 type:complete len:301 (-) Transcript_56180:35-937(-)
MCRSGSAAVTDRGEGPAEAPGAAALPQAEEAAGGERVREAEAPWKRQAAEDIFSRQTTAADEGLSRHSSPSSSCPDLQAVSDEPQPPKNGTVIVFDWDDTLLCTSFLNLHPDHESHPAVQSQLRGIEEAVKQLLEQSLRLGQTFIVTNAVSGWVEYSAAQYIPGVVPLLKQVQIISARARFEDVFPEEMSRWKTETFLDMQREVDLEETTNIVSLGDSALEIDAAHVLAGACDAATGRGDSSSSGVPVKTVKFRERPSAEELRKQLELVAGKFERIVQSSKGLTIGLERKWAGSPQKTDL